MGFFDRLFKGKGESELEIEKQKSDILSNKYHPPLSKPQLLLLSKFLHFGLRENVTSDGWTKVLGEPSENVIETFLKEGLLREGNLQEKMESKFSVNDLKVFSRVRDLPVTGKKSLLIERLIQADKKEMESFVENENIIICSDKGKLIAEEYLAKEKEIRLAAEQKVLSYLQEENFVDAVNTIANFEAQQVFSNYNKIDWKKHDEEILKLIYSKTPKNLDEFSREEIDILRPVAAMMYLWRTNQGEKWIPPNFSTTHRFNAKIAANMFIKHAYFLNTIEDCKKTDVKKVEIIAARDSCDECRNHDRKIFKIDSVPELPSAKCTHKYGCRCSVAPVVLDKEWDKS